MAYVGFKKLAAKTSPAIAAAIGRKKYGKKKFQKAASEGKKMKGMKPKRKGGIISKLQRGGEARTEMESEFGKKYYRIRKRGQKMEKKDFYTNNKWMLGQGTKKEVKQKRKKHTKYNKLRDKLRNIESERYELRNGGIGAGKSPGVDTATTIDGTTYYQKGGKVYPKTAKTAVDSAAYASGREWDEEYKRLGGGKAGITLNKHYKQGVSDAEESNLNKIQKGLKDANVKRSINNPDEVKARAIRRAMQSEQKEKSRIFKKGGKMKYKKGGIVSKLQRGGQGTYDREDESLGMRLGRGKGTAKERNLSYGKWGSRGKDWKTKLQKGGAIEEGITGKIKKKPKDETIKKKPKEGWVEAPPGTPRRGGARFEKGSYPTWKKEDIIEGVKNLYKPKNKLKKLQKGGLVSKLFKKKKDRKYLQEKLKELENYRNTGDIKDIKTLSGKKVRKGKWKKKAKDWEKLEPSRTPKHLMNEKSKYEDL